MNREIMNKQLECYREYIQLLEIAKDVLSEMNEKTFSKRVTKKIEQVAEQKGLNFYVYQDGDIVFNYIGVGAISRNRTVGSYTVRDYQFSFNVHFSEGKKIDSIKTIDGINTAINKRKESIKKLEDTMEHYEELKAMKKEINEMIAKHNSNIHHLFEELKIR